MGKEQKQETNKDHYSVTPAKTRFRVKVEETVKTC